MTDPDPESMALTRQKVRAKQRTHLRPPSGLLASRVLAPALATRHTDPPQSAVTSHSVTTQITVFTSPESSLMATSSTPLLSSFFLLFSVMKKMR